VYTQKGTRQGAMIKVIAAFCNKIVSSYIMVSMGLSF
jgi:hypothetical protein